MDIYDWTFVRFLFCLSFNVFSFLWGKEHVDVQLYNVEWQIP